MSDVSSHEADHASDLGSHGHVPIDPNDAVVRAMAPTPTALIVAAVAAVADPRSRWWPSPGRGPDAAP